MIKLRLNKIGPLLKETAVKWWDRDPFRESGVIAYNAIFSLPGLLVVVITLAGYFFGQEAVSGKLHQQITGMMGRETADQIQKMIIAANKTRESIWAAVIGVITIIIGATGVFVQLQKSLNSIWEVKATTQKSGIWAFLKTRLFSFGLIISIAFLLLVSLVLSSVLSALGDWISANRSESLLIVFKILNFVISLFIITVLFALMFKILPDVKTKWHPIWVGAFLTALLFVIGKSGLGLYFGKAQPGSGYGAAGSIILILLWASYSSMIVFFGAEFTKIYSDYYYGKLPPDENAVKKSSSGTHG
ncbi:MAG: rbn [Bacteroidetes bacterium]|jgi:membrane protein|nr:rbn [Bacteroidota bacterium]